MPVQGIAGLRRIEDGSTSRSSDASRNTFRSRDGDRASEEVRKAVPGAVRIVLDIIRGAR